MMNKICQKGVLILIILMLAGCIVKRHDHQLAHVQEIVSEAPDSALSLLNRIDPTELSSSDRHFYDFLTIKAKDKAYVTHCSDSLILDVLDYYSSHNSESLYPEALYYAGRVYCDLGDRPTALRYFQQALDRMPEKGKAAHLNLKLRILSQTARLLTSLRLYDEAIPYLREVSTIEEQLNDTISTVQDLQLLGWNFFKSEKFDSAENVLKETLLYSNNVDSSLVAKSKVYLAATKYHRGENDSALFFIRNTYDQVNPLVRNNALSFGVSIYLQANKLDTAYLLAKELVESKDQLNKKIGYSALLSPELEAYVSPELQKQYISEYRNLLESFVDESSVQLAVTQQALYNYQLHEREKIQAEQANVRLWKVIFAISSLILLLGILLLYIKNRNKTTVIRLQNALENIRLLTEELNIATQHNEVKVETPETEEQIEEDPAETEPESEAEAEPEENLSVPNSEELPTTPLPQENTEEQPADSDYNLELTQKFDAEVSVINLRKRLLEELLTLSNSNPSPKLATEISSSPVYDALNHRITLNKIIKCDDKLWRDLEKVVLGVSPNFKRHLRLLTGQQLTDLEYQTALLIKCHIKPAQMATVAGRTRSTIGSRQNYLGLKIFGEKIPPKLLTKIIRNL